MLSVPGPSVPGSSVPGAAIGLDHIGIVTADLDALAGAFTALGFQLTPYATHASGRTANRCVMLRDGGYLELMAVVPGQSSTTLDRFLNRGQGAHILALEIRDEVAALARLARAGIAAEASVTEREAAGGTVRFALLMPPDPPEGRVLLIRHLNRELLSRPDLLVHPNHAAALSQAVFHSDAPAETMAHLSRVAGRPTEPDPRGGFRIVLGRGAIIARPRLDTGPPMVEISLAVDAGEEQVISAGGVNIRLVPRSC